MDPSILSEDFQPLTKKDNALIRESNMHEEAGYVSVTPATYKNETESVRRKTRSAVLVMHCLMFIILKKESDHVIFS